VQSFEQFIRENKNEITALQILYSRPCRRRLTRKQIDELAKAIERPPRAWTTTASSSLPRETAMKPSENRLTLPPQEQMA